MLRVGEIRPWAFAGVVGLVCASCGSDEPDNGGDGTDDPSPSSSAYVLFNRIQLPTGRMNYVNVLPQLATVELDLGQAIELGGFSRVRRVDDDLLVFFGESGQVARYSVAEDLSLNETARFSMASEGITSFPNALVFISETRAYFIDDSLGRVVVWNPREMSLTSSFPFDLAVDNFPNVVMGSPSVVGDFVLAPVAWTNADGSVPRDVVGVARFSASEDRFIDVVVDNRCGYSITGFVDGDRFYISGDWRAGLFAAYSAVELTPPCMLTFDPATGQFEGDAVNLAEATGRPATAGVYSAGPGRAAILAYDAPVSFDEIPTQFPDFRAYPAQEFWRWGLMDLETNMVQFFDALPLSSLSFPPSVVDGGVVVGIAEESLGTSTLFRLDVSSATATSVLDAPGEILNTLRIR